MAKTKAERRAELEAQMAELENEPDEPQRGGRGENLNFTIDLSDEAAVERALSLGLLTRADVEADDDADDDGDGDDPKKPKDDSPRRRLSGADRLMQS